jgi:hypothetical protein
MLDLITLFSAVGLQEELGQNSKSPVITAQESDTSIVEDAAENLSVAFETIESALSASVGALFSPASEPVAQEPCKKA